MDATKTPARPSLLWRGSTLDNFTLQLTQSGLSRIIAHLSKQPYLKDFVAGNYTRNLSAAVARSLAQLTQDALYIGTISDPNSNQKIRVFESTNESGTDYQILALAVSKTESTIISVRLVTQSEETEYFLGAALGAIGKIAAKVVPKVLPKIKKVLPKIGKAARSTAQKARPLGRRTLQKARPVARRTLQKARPLGRRTLQKVKPIGRRTLQKARPLGRRTLQKARPLGRRTLQKVKPLGRLGSRRRMNRPRPTAPFVQRPQQLKQHLSSSISRLRDRSTKSGVRTRGITPSEAAQQSQKPSFPTQFYQQSTTKFPDKYMCAFFASRHFLRGNYGNLSQDDFIKNAIQPLEALGISREEALEMVTDGNDPGVVKTFIEKQTGKQLDPLDREQILSKLTKNEVESIILPLKKKAHVLTILKDRDGRWWNYDSLLPQPQQIQDLKGFLQSNPVHYYLAG